MLGVEKPTRPDAKNVRQDVPFQSDSSHTPENPAFFSFDNSFAEQLTGFYVRWPAKASPKPQPIRINHDLARILGCDPALLETPAGIDFLAGNRMPAGADPIAQAYAGHQFGHFSPQLGDGRALILGEIIDTQGARRDIAFKGSGPTPFSRRGDGKCALGPALREYLIGEAMHALGIPTTRALAVVATGEMIRRDRPLPGAVLTRIAASHIRVGTFEYFAAHHGPDHVRKLADYVIARHYPELIGTDKPYLALFASVAERQAELIARWLGVGFIHGVMNTDNMTLSGETIDYGPCAFMESYHPATVFSSIDSQGRYAYGQQADIAQWNLARLGESLLPLIDADEKQALDAANQVLADFPRRHATHWLRIMRDKLGLDTTSDEAADRRLVEDFLLLMKQSRSDFTQAFRALTRAAHGDGQTLMTLFAGQAKFPTWLASWQARQPVRPTEVLDRMQQANPVYIPRNHLVENALDAAVDRNDLAAFERLLAVVTHPCQERLDDASFGEPAAREFTNGYQTFCGT